MFSGRASLNGVPFLRQPAVVVVVPMEHCNQGHTASLTHLESNFIPSFLSVRQMRLVLIPVCLLRNLGGEWMRALTEMWGLIQHAEVGSDANADANVVPHLPLPRCSLHTPVVCGSERGFTLEQ